MPSPIYDELLLRIDEFRERSGLKLTLSHFEGLCRVHKLLLEDIQMHPTLPSLVKAAGINERDLKRMFKVVFGKNMYRLLIEARINHARKELATSNKAVFLIANECGYDNPDYFTNFFKRHVGMTPTAYRKLGSCEKV